MQIQAIGNSKAAFGHSQKNKMAEAYAFANMDDSQVRDLAYKLSYDENEIQKHKRKVATMFSAIPIIDTIAGGILAKKVIFDPKAQEVIKIEKPALSTRAKVAGIVAAGWLAITGVVGAYRGVKKTLNSNSETMERFDRKHPVSSFMLDLGIIFAGMAALFAGGKKVINKFPKAQEEFVQKIESLSDKIDASRFSKKSLPKIEASFAKFAQKNPKLASAGEKLLRNNVIVGLGVALLTILHFSNKESRKVKNNYAQLKEAQLQTAKKLNKTLKVQRDVLAQNQIILKNELEYQMAKSQKEITQEKEFQTEQYTEHHIEHHPEPDPKPKKPIE